MHRAGISVGSKDVFLYVDPNGSFVHEALNWLIFAFTVP